MPRSASTSVASNAVRAESYGIPGVLVEENSVEEIYEAAAVAIDRARSGQGPTLMEIRTLRLWGHFEGDAQGYRADLDSVASRDPIPLYESQLRTSGILDDQLVKEIKEEAVSKVESAIEFAKASPIPEPSSALKYVFAE